MSGPLCYVAWASRSSAALCLNMFRKRSSAIKSILLTLTCLLTGVNLACNEPGEVNWEYVVPDNYEGYLAIRFNCPGGQPLIKHGVAHVEFKSDGTFCTSDAWTPTWESRWFPTMRRSPHQSASGKPIEMPAETPKSGYVLCFGRTASYCGSTFVVLWAGNMPATRVFEDEDKFLDQHFDLAACHSPNP